MAYLGTQPNNVKKNIGIYTPSEIYQLEKDGNWSGSLEFISETTVSSANQVVLTDLKENIYDVHYFTLVLTGAHQDHTIFLDFSTNGGTGYVTDDLAYSKSYGQSNSTFNQATNPDLYGIQVAQSVDSNNGCYNYGYLYHLGNASRFSHYSGFSVFERSGDSGVLRFEYGGGVYRNNATINALRFYPNTGNMTGKLKLYGIKK